MWMDTHCHLDPTNYDGDEGVDAAVGRAREAGVTFMATIGSGYGPDGIERARDVADRHEGVWFTAGLHPHDAKHWSDDVVRRIRAVAEHPKYVAVGEMGLDFHYDLSERDVQRTCLREQVALARELAKPVVIHDRDTGEETFRILVEEGAFDGAGVLFHCYCGDVRHMHEIVEAGGYISIPGIVTFKNAGVMREVAAAVPEDRLLVETDSPFLTPVPFRGKKNEPARVIHVGEAVAGIRGVSPEALARVTTENAFRFYGIGG